MYLRNYMYFQDPAGIFDLVEVVGNGTYGQVYKVAITFVDEAIKKIFQFLLI